MQPTPGPLLLSVQQHFKFTLTLISAKTPWQHHKHSTDKITIPDVTPAGLEAFNLSFCSSELLEFPIDSFSVQPTQNWQTLVKQSFAYLIYLYGGILLRVVNRIFRRWLLNEKIKVQRITIKKPCLLDVSGEIISWPNSETSINVELPTLSKQMTSTVWQSKKSTNHRGILATDKY